MSLRLKYELFHIHFPKEVLLSSFRHEIPRLHWIIHSQYLGLQVMFIFAHMPFLCRFTFIAAGSIPFLTCPSYLQFDGLQKPRQL